MIFEFVREYEFLNNFFPSPFKVNGIEYATVEHYYQAQKSCSFVEKKRIAAASSPELAKKMGRQCDLRGDWEEIKVQVMREGLWHKFNIPGLRQLLLNTGDEELMEGNSWHDNIWGNCFCEACENKPGRNLLGLLLMELRQDILQGVDFEKYRFETGVRPMKYHIIGPNSQPLTWQDMVLEFDNQEAALEFYNSWIKIEPGEARLATEIKESILYYDGGYYNATNKIVVYDQEQQDNKLVNKNPLV